MADLEIPKLPPKPFWVPSFLEPPNFELATQVEEYRTLPWYESYRKISSILLLFQVFIVLFFALVGPRTSGVSPVVLVSAIYLLLAILVRRGNQVATRVAMVIFTLDRILGIAASFANPLAWGIGLGWWLFFMERFWKALRVEQARKLLSRPRDHMASGIAVSDP